MKTLSVEPVKTEFVEGFLVHVHGEAGTLLASFPFLSLGEAEDWAESLKQGIRKFRVHDEATKKPESFEPLNCQQCGKFLGAYLDTAHCSDPDTYCVPCTEAEAVRDELEQEAERRNEELERWWSKQFDD